MNKLNKRLLAAFTVLVMGFGTLFAQGTKDNYLNSYLTLESLTDNDTITLRIPAALTSDQLAWVAYSTDSTNWTVMEVDGTLKKDTVILNQGEKVFLKGYGKQCNIVVDNYWHYLRLKGSGDHVVYGNIMSLLYGDDFASQTAFPDGSTYAFSYLFHSDRHLVSVENLVLPATTLAYGCYYGMFIWCSSLSSPVPELPATELVDRCYQFMYYNCELLTEAPALPATTLAPLCYYRMFNECISLTTAPELPATTLAHQCYLGMFNGCTSLTTAPSLPATTLTERCYQQMFNGCASLTTAPALPATTLADNCYYGMFYECTSLTTAPVLPATTLTNACYGYMFGGCSSLTEAPALLATTMADLSCSCMFAQCTSLTQAPALPATSLATECYAFMFYDCTSLTDAPALPANVMAPSCYKAMFAGCSSLTKGPDLTAPVLVFECYAGLFERCVQLQEVVCLATDLSAESCVETWMEGVASRGIFYKAPEMNDWPLNSTSGIPEGWAVANYDGVDELQKQVTVYPNPVVDKLHISGTDIQSVKLYDVQGRLVRSESYDHADQVELDFQGYAKGIYSVTILSHGQVVSKKIVY